ncbi:MAG: YIP1 family protein [Rhodobacteraceae bacterium]|nr:YIP1 family protein [Paracoccaceae bacterium]
MSLTADLLASYRAPRRVLRRHLARGATEGRALMFLMLGCALVFVAQWPRLMREAELDPAVPLDARMAGAFFGWLCLAPLLFYALAAASHLVAQVIGGRGSWFAARLALFWALLAVSPVVLAQGLAAGFLDDGAAMAGLGIVTLGIFLYLWFAGLAEAERGAGAGPAAQRG